MNHNRRAAALAPVLVVTALVTSVISSLGAPLIPTIARDFHDSLSTAQWSLTIALLAGAVSAPLMGRLGDGPRRRATMIGGLAVVTLGGVIAAVASGLDVLIVGRAMQGVGLGLVPAVVAWALSSRGTPSAGDQRLDDDEIRELERASAGGTRRRDKRDR